MALTLRTSTSAFLENSMRDLEKPAEGQQAAPAADASELNPTLVAVNEALDRFGGMNIPEDQHERLSWLHDFAQAYEAARAPAVRPEPDTVPWPTVTRYSGGASHGGVGARVWVRLAEDGHDVEYVPAVRQPVAPNDRCAILLATLLQYARHPATHNAPSWVGILVPDDFLSEAESALAGALEADPPPSAAAPVGWCALTPSGQIAYFDGKPMVMPGPVGNEHHTVPIYAGAAPAVQGLSDADKPAANPGQCPTCGEYSMSARALQGLYGHTVMIDGSAPASWVDFKSAKQAGIVAGDGKPCPNDHDPDCRWPNCRCRDAARALKGGAE
jgi:hypothetical protein